MITFASLTGLAESLTQADATLVGAFLGVIMAFLILFLIIGIAVYIYSALAFMAIAKKTRTEPAGIAWIPLVGPAIISSRIAQMHWWPILLLIGFLIPFVGMLFVLAYSIFSIIWMWKTFEAVNRPGWWAILVIIPLVGWIIFLILLGVAAWGNKT